MTETQPIQGPAK